MLRALDLFCGAGGVSVGLARAGFEVCGVDINPQPNYPFWFLKRDALQVSLDGYDFIWASPPCQASSSLRFLHQSREYPQLIEATRERLRASGAPYCIENVIGAPLINPIMLCGSAFGLRVRRHRLFETSFVMLAPGCDHGSQGRPLDVSGTGGPRVHTRRLGGGGDSNKPRDLEEASAAMGIDWMTRKEISQAIPPAYAELIGRAAIQYIEQRRAA